MKIVFSLAWVRAGLPVRRVFKSKETGLLFQEFVKRISHHAPCEVSSGTGFPGAALWLCDRAVGKNLSSDELAGKLQATLNTGTKKIVIVIGGPDGFTRDEIKKLAPGFVWSFGPLTLPHELAAVLAAEQIYRAFTILHNHPYHAGH